MKSAENIYIHAIVGYTQNMKQIGKREQAKCHSIIFVVYSNIILVINFHLKVKIMSHLF